MHFAAERYRTRPTYLNLASQRRPERFRFKNIMRKLIK